MGGVRMGHEQEERCEEDGKGMEGVRMGGGWEK